MTTKTLNTKPLTKTQLDYLGTRIDAARKARIEKFIQTVPLLNPCHGSEWVNHNHRRATVEWRGQTNPHEMTVAGMVHAIHSGTAVLKTVVKKVVDSKTETNGNSTCITDLYQFPRSQTAVDWQNAFEAQKAAANAFTHQLDAEEQELRDKLYLAGADEALAAVKAFGA